MSASIRLGIVGGRAGGAAPSPATGVHGPALGQQSRFVCGGKTK